MRRFGYPALVVYSPKKEAFVVSKDAFEAGPTADFLRRIANGFVKPQPITGSLAKVAETEPWDGGEAQISNEEEIPLDELMKDEF